MFMNIMKLKIKRMYYLYAVVILGLFLFISSNVILQESSEKLRNGKTLVIQKYRKLHISYVVVHIDLKRTPLKLEFLAQVLLTLKEHGANGLLMEYEDMFPYEGNLINISAKNCYAKSELQDFLKVATELGFEIIPLIQTFGHLESVLELDEFKHLRENPAFSNSICPSKSESALLIKDMVEQMIKLHTSVIPLKHIHIGCDEVYHINECNICKNRKLSHLQIYLEHIQAVTSMVKAVSKEINILIWEDMLGISSPANWNYQVEIPIEPVYWDYRTTLNVSHIHLMLYHKTFSNIWIATAFKGADGITSKLPNIRNRFLNHFIWLKFISNYKFGGETEIYKFKGIILTGWSRYFTMAPSCDTFPASIPSLILNLLLINEFKTTNIVDSDALKHPSIFFQKYLKDKLEKSLKCDTINIALNNSDNTVILNFDNMYLHECDFDGFALYQIIKEYLFLRTFYMDSVILSHLDKLGIKADWYFSNNIDNIRDKLIQNMHQYYDAEFVTN